VVGSWPARQWACSLIISWRFYDFYEYYYLLITIYMYSTKMYETNRRFNDKTVSGTCFTSTPTNIHVCTTQLSTQKCFLLGWQSARRLLSSRPCSTAQATRRSFPAGVVDIHAHSGQARRPVRTWRDVCRPFIQGCHESRQTYFSFTVQLILDGVSACYIRAIRALKVTWVRDQV